MENFVIYLYLCKIRTLYFIWQTILKERETECLEAVKKENKIPVHILVPVE